MAIYQDGYLFADDNHSGLIQPIGPHAMPIHRRYYFGLKGEGHVVSKPAGRDLVAEILFENFATRALLQATIDAKEQYAAIPLGGDVTQTIGGADTVTYASCTFLGLELTEAPRRDGATATWLAFGFLRWRQRVPN